MLKEVKRKEWIKNRNDLEGELVEQDTGGGGRRNGKEIHRNGMERMEEEGMVEYEERNGYRNIGKGKTDES